MHVKIGLELFQSNEDAEQLPCVLIAGDPFSHGPNVLLV